MNQILHPLIILIPALAACLGKSLPRQGSLAVTGLTLILSLLLLTFGQPTDGPLRFDGLNSWLLPFACVIAMVLMLCVPRSERCPASSARLLCSLALDLAFFSAPSPLALAVLWPLTLGPMLGELRARHAPRRTLRILAVFQGSGALLFAAGALACQSNGPANAPLWAWVLVASGIGLRQALLPLHQWLSELFERGPLPTAIAFCAPQLGAYAALRLLAPGAPHELLVGMGVAALVTAVYGACLACGQSSLRSAYSGLFMGQTSLVFAGLQCTTEVGLTGGLCLWISGGLALTGLGVTIHALEARRGRMSLDRYHGGFDRCPTLAASFLIFGLTSIGFPGTLGFVSEELLFEGTTHIYTYVGVLAAVTAALNGVTVMRLYFHLFCGSREVHALSQSMRTREKLATLLLVSLLLGFGLLPQWFVSSRRDAVDQILSVRIDSGRHRVHPHPPGLPDTNN